MKPAQAPVNEPHPRGASDRASKPIPAPRRRSLQSGFSLLARAEPRIWFTGGMLAVCLAMVVCLLTLILASGLPTFWPQPIDWLALRSGELDIGERQSAIVKTPNAVQEIALDATSPEAGSETGHESAEVSGMSYYYRTENFDVTNSHYRWFEPRELSVAGIVRVPQTTLIERYEWGHLYGIPLRIQEPLGIGDDDQQRIGDLNHFAATLQRLTESQSADDAAAADPGSSAGALQVVRQRTQELLDQSLRRRIAAAGDRLIQIQVEGDKNWRAKSVLTDAMKVEAARVLILDRDQVMNQLKDVMVSVDAQRRELSRLKDTLSRLDVEISRLRIAVRQAELDTTSVLPVQLDATHALLEQQAIFKQQIEDVVKARQQLAEWNGDGINRSSLQRSLDDYEQQWLPSQLAVIEQQLTDWRKPLESSPPELREAVSRYEDGYAGVAIRKQPIQKQISRLQSELDAGELIVCIPNGAKPISDLSQQNAAELARGSVTSELADRFKALDLELGVQPAVSLFSNDSLTMFSVTDKSELNHIVAITDPKCLEKSASGVNLLTEHPVAFKELVRVLPVNQLSIAGKVGTYLSRWREFLFEDPREANTLGGVFPAIWGTIVMTLIMTVAVVPFGVMAALYLREYTNGGPLVSIIRISINNLAGVPSIVYGVFGFSFFCMTIGSFIDGGPKGADITVWPSGRWYFMLWATVAVGTSAFLFSFMSSGPAHTQTQLKRYLAKGAFVLWLICLLGAIAIVAKSPFFGGFYAAQLPNPTFGKGGLLWASLTLALLTLPVVIVATEEALSAVPNSLREGSLACGASKWQTIRRIVLPHARPGILTGAILAMARGAGEVAPLMLVGALPNAPELPLDGEFPFFHGSRNFMHLGYQIYSLGFQSQNSEAAKPMVFTCTLLLILIVASLNIVAIYLRTRLRRRFQGNQF